MEKTEVIEIAARHRLNLDEDSLEFINVGLDFQVVIGSDYEGERWVLRIPRRPDSFLKLAIEKNILNLVNQSVSTFEVPVWEVYSKEVIAYRVVKGEPAVTTHAATEETTWLFDVENVPDTYIDSLARALAALHSIPNTKASKLGLPVQSAHGLQQAMRNRMNRVKKNYEVNNKLWGRWQAWLENDDIWPEQTGFIHGDLYPGHTLVNTEFEVTAIIDWTEAKVSDIANDFTAFYLLFGEEALDHLIQSYKDAGGYTWPKMKAHIIELLSTQAITLAEFAETSGIDAYADAAREMLKNDQ